MSKHYKFQALQDYFLKCENDEIELTFGEIENKLGFKLSDSAYRYDTYWRDSPTHTITHAWNRAGYEIGKLSVNKNIILFVKSGKNPQQSLHELFPVKSTRYKTNNTISEEEVDNLVAGCNKYFEDLKKDNNARYLSWEHCYKAFKEFKNKEMDQFTIDYLSLHLGFYLASWGMYRGSSFLLQKDYKVHKEAVIEIYKKEYQPLWSIECKEYNKNTNQDLLNKLYQNLLDIYIKHRNNIDERNDVSDTLMTKILMGTLGCVPAYDRYFLGGIKQGKVASSNYGMNSIMELVSFYEKHTDQLENCRKRISSIDLEYPQMKILDMCFWQVGYNEANVPFQEPAIP